MSIETLKLIYVEGDILKPLLEKYPSTLSIIGDHISSETIIAVVSGSFEPYVERKQISKLGILFVDLDHFDKVYDMLVKTMHTLKETGDFNKAIEYMESNLLSE